MAGFESGRRLGGPSVFDRQSRNLALTDPTLQAGIPLPGLRNIAPMIDVLIRRRAAGLAALALALPLFGAPAAAQAPAMAMPVAAPARNAGPFLSADQRENYIKAFIAVDAGRWDEARRLAQRGNDALANKLLRWLELQQPRSGFSFEDIAAFVDAHPDWPGQDIMVRRAEEALVDRTDDSVVLAWFALRGPITVDGAMRYAEALMRNNERTKAVALIRKTWVTGTFGAKQEKAFTVRYRPLLGPDDHNARLSYLLWERRYDEARRVMPLVDTGHRALADARMRLAKMSGGIDAALARVPANLVSDPGLIYERMRWRIRKRQEKAALDTVLNPPADLGRPDVWWNERELLARRAIADGRMSEAYRIVRDHRLTGGADLIEAEFMAGWIALRFTNDPKMALAHFTKLYDVARFPVTKARGAYWAGRAATAAKDPAGAQTWYKRAAAFPVAYYGQLALNQLDPAARAWPAPPAVTPADRQAFDTLEMTRAAKLMNELGQSDRVKPFIARLVTRATTPAQHVLTAELAQSFERPDLAVSSVKRSVQTAGVMLLELGWPVVQLPPGEEPERALVLATIRQESAFEPEAISRAGARGMMQLMPATARLMARATGQAGHSDHKLLADSNYNIRLGRSYMAHLLDDFDNSYVLALAAYNAGPGRVRQWMRDNGDPRKANVDVVDWVEMIPFDETRNYVQRVLENLQVYRQRLGVAQAAVAASPDLRRRW